MSILRIKAYFKISASLFLKLIIAKMFANNRLSIWGRHRERSWRKADRRKKATSQGIGKRKD